MKSPEPFRMPGECWGILLPGLAAGGLTGCGISEWIASWEDPPGMWLSSVFVVTAIVLMRSLLRESIELFKPDEEDFGYDTANIVKRLALIQVPMFVAGLLVSFSTTLALWHMSTDARIALAIVFIAFFGVGRLLDAERSVAKWQVLFTIVAIFFSVILIAVVLALATSCPEFLHTEL